MIILNSSLADVNTIFNLYNQATEHQKKVFTKNWVGFEKSLIEAEILENHQWKIIVDGQIACVFATTFNDPLIWEEKDLEPSIYIHRIATATAFRGNGFVKHIANWAVQYAKTVNRSFVRLDTWGGNNKLNQYYMDCGFTYLGTRSLKDSSRLPAHYKEGELYSLFEIPV